MQNRKRDTDVQNRLLDSVAEGENGMFRENSIETWYYLGWNRSPAQVGCMRQVLGPGALGRPRGIGWRGRWEGGSGWGTHVNPWLIHFNVWQKPLQYCKVISLQLIKINEGKKKDSTCQCGAHEFNPWSGKISHAMGQPSTYGHYDCWARALEPASRNYWSAHVLEPVLCNREAIAVWSLRATARQ